MSFQLRRYTVCGHQRTLEISRLRARDEDYKGHLQEHVERRSHRRQLVARAVPLGSEVRPILEPESVNYVYQDSMRTPEHLV